MVQHRELEGPVREKQGFVLGVDVDQPAGKLREHADGDRFVIHERSGPSALPEHTADNEIAPVPVHTVGIEDFADRRIVLDMEFSFDDAVLRIFPNHGSIRLGSQEKGKGTQDYGLACSCLPGNNDETRRKINIQRVYQNIVPDL